MVVHARVCVCVCVCVVCVCVCITHRHLVTYHHLPANVPQTVLCDIMHPNASCWSHYLQYLAKVLFVACVCCTHLIETPVLIALSQCLQHFFQYSVRFYVPLNIVSVLLFQRYHQPPSTIESPNQ